MIDYIPTKDEIEVARLIAERRNSLNFGGSNIPGGEYLNQQERLLQHFQGALAEIAVSRIYNLCWSGCGKGSNGCLDVGNCLQVRSVADSKRGLLCRQKDVSEHPCVLVQVLESNQCILVGWEHLSRVKTEGWVLDRYSHKPAWVLPRDHLRSLESFNPLYWRKRR